MPPRTHTIDVVDDIEHMKQTLVNEILAVTEKMRKMNFAIANGTGELIYKAIQKSERERRS